MKIFPKLQAGCRRHRAFTLVEMMVATGIYLGIVVGVIVAIQIFALRVYTLAATKLTATQSSRKALNQIRDDIRQAKTLQVGTADNSGNFTPTPGTNGVIGNALQIFYTTNGTTSAPYTPPYSIYYLQTNTLGSVAASSLVSSNNLLWLYVTTNGSTTANLSTYITNLDIFSAQDCYGNTISNNLKNNQVFTVKLQFYQWEYPIAIVSTNGGLNAYDYYQLRTKVCRRALD
jgi:type II secretory pathway pseudopilin PulG